MLKNKFERRCYKRFWQYKWLIYYFVGILCVKSIKYKKGV